MNHTEPRSWRVFRYATLVFLVIVFLLPLVWVLQTSFKGDAEIFSQPPKFVPLPEATTQGLDEEGFLATFAYTPTLVHYRQVFMEFPFFRYLVNTFIVVIFTVIGTLLSCTMVAYALACLRWPDRQLVFALVLATLLLPYPVTLIPLYMLYRGLGWIDTFLPLIIPQFLAPSFFVFLLRQHFITIPRSMLDAARVDGAGEMRILWQIIAPQSKPALLTVTIFSAMWAWNDFLGPLIYLNSEEKKTLAVGIQSMVSESATEWGLLMAAGTLMIVPILILFFFAQRYFIQGFTLSGTKG